MTVQQFLQSKEPNVFIIPEEWLEEYANIVLNIAAEKATTKTILREDKKCKSIVDKNSILNCLKD